MLKNLLLLLLTFYSVSISTQTITATVTPDPVRTGSDVTLNITYTGANANSKIYAAVELKNSDETWAKTIAEATLNPVPATSGSTTQTLTMPSDTVITSELTNGQYYDFKIELKDANWNWVAGVYPTLSITEALSVSGSEKAPAKLFPNPVKNQLNIIPLDTNKQFNAYKIFDISGKTVLSSSKTVQKSVNVSTLSKGLYFLQLDNYKTVRFIKQ